MNLQDNGYIDFELLEHVADTSHQLFKNLLNDVQLAARVSGISVDYIAKCFYNGEPIYHDEIEERFPINVPNKNVEDLTEMMWTLIQKDIEEIKEKYDLEVSLNITEQTNDLYIPIYTLKTNENKKYFSNYMYNLNS